MKTMRKPVIAGNWKMFKLVSDASATALALKPLVANGNHCEIVIAPVYTALKSVEINSTVQTFTSLRRMFQPKRSTAHIRAKFAAIWSRTQALRT